jgi:hypothetical protein
MRPIYDCQHTEHRADCAGLRCARFRAAWSDCTRATMKTARRDSRARADAAHRQGAMPITFPLSVCAGRAIVDARGNVVAIVHARRRLNQKHDVHDADAIDPTEADRFVHEIADTLNNNDKGTR